MREGKVLRVLLSGRWLPRNHFWKVRQAVSVLELSRFRDNSRERVLEGLRPMVTLGFNLQHRMGNLEVKVSPKENSIVDTSC